MGRPISYVGPPISYVGRTNQNLEMRLLQHQDSISSALKQNPKPEDFTSALSEHIFDFPDHFIFAQFCLFDL